MGLLKEFKEFATKGNVVDLAVGLIIGAAFGSVVSSLVNDVLMPPLGYLAGKVDFSELSVDIPVGQMELAVASATESVAATTSEAVGLAEEAGEAATRASDAAEQAEEAAQAAPDGSPEQAVAEAGAQVAEAGAKVAEAGAAAATTAAPAAEEKPEARVVRIMYGRFINACITFIIQAFAVFLIVKAMNRLRAKKEKDVAAGVAKPAELTTEERLLTEIRDLMAGRQAPIPPVPPTR